jgi:hypothetical protein
MKATYSKMAGQNVRNNWGAAVVSLTVAACTALVLFSRCQPEVEQRMIDADQPRNGDRICEQSEAYPRKMDAKRMFIAEKNPKYSKQDCHDGDGVYDDSIDVRDMDGNKAILPPAYLDGKPVTRPMEGVDSIDYRLKIIREQPCIPGVPGKDTKKIDRPLVSANPGEMVIRSEAEWEQIVRDPSGLPSSIFDPASGNDSFKRPWLYQETCDTNPKVPDCAPNVNERCYCANNVKCPPRAKPPETKPRRVPAKCGNGKVEAGEDCDPQGTACKTGEGKDGTCNQRCSCEAKPVAMSDCTKSRVEQVRTDINTKIRLAQGEIFKNLKLDGDLKVNYDITIFPSGKIVATKMSVKHKNENDEDVSTDVSKYVSLEGVQADNQATEICHFKAVYHSNASR